MQLYDRDAIERAVGLDGEALAAVEAGFAALGRGEAVQPPILSMAIEEANGEVDVKTAHIRGAERFAIKVSPGFFDNPRLGLPSLNGLMMVFSARTGRVEAVLFDEGYLTLVRTLLGRAIAARHLAREDSRRVTVLGAGEQAERQVEALRLVRDIRALDVWARRREAAEAYAARMRARGLDVRIHDSVHEACARADIIVTATPSREPILFARDLPEGVHVTAMGSDSPEKRELDASVLSRADAFVVDTRTQSEINGELKAFAGGEVPFKVHELGRVIAEGQRLRLSPATITVCDLTGTGVQDTAIADFALSRLAPL
ncbi:cyclodeaminase [Halomonas beimenensis]|uniref:Ectoine utilization protein EutC, similar to ornithine cyclodeaminase n=1 Tax=Halomonas beimenensis TaxID=475662 RepID=A0A291PAK2_9GAMM|nr:cyclodeaminase [Halomonas beimenensis]ATJ83933.1 ectoine utilization protein EutC, similar to ornithine cyclodeaminase [Halomonas beimenensis]